MLKYHFPPTVNEDGSLTVTPMEGVIRPANPPGGYEYDPQSQTHVPLWPPCKDRESRMWPRQCGSTGITMYCRCEGCPLRGRIVKLDDCDDCQFRNEQD